MPCNVVIPWLQLVGKVSLINKWSGEDVSVLMKKHNFEIVAPKSGLSTKFIANIRNLEHTPLCFKTKYLHYKPPKYMLYFLLIFSTSLENNIAPPR